MRRTRIRVDPNDQRGGLVRALRSDANGALDLGAAVIAYEPEDHVRFDAVVRVISHDYVELELDPSSMLLDVQLADWQFLPQNWWADAAPVSETAGRSVILPTERSDTEDLRDILAR